MSYDEKLELLASTLPIAFSSTREAALVAEAHKHPNISDWVEKTARHLLDTRQNRDADFNSALDAIGDQIHRQEGVMLSALRDAIRLLARQRVSNGQLQPA